MIKVFCQQCNKPLERWPKDLRVSPNSFCDVTCQNKFFGHGSVTVPCGNCQKLVTRGLNQYKRSKSKNAFCTQKCAAEYNNKHKTTGYRRSKLEIFLEQQLLLRYPNLEIKFNDRTVIDFELDIYIPKLCLAFEINGIVHYEPIYGQDKLVRIINNDKQKMIRCYEKGIELAVINTSHIKYLTPQKANTILMEVCNIIDMNRERETSTVPLDTDKAS